MDTFIKNNFPNLKEIHVCKDKEKNKEKEIDKSKFNVDIDVVIRMWYDCEQFDKGVKLFIEPDFDLHNSNFGLVLKSYFDNLSDMELSNRDNLSFIYTDQLGKVIKRDKRIVQENGWRFKKVNFKTKFVNCKKFLNLGSYFTCIQFISIDTDLTQEQLDLLPKFSPLVKKVIFSDNFKSCSKDDYKFLCKFGHLKVFFSDDSRCFEHIGNIIENCEYFIRGESSFYVVRPKKSKKILIKDIETEKKQTFTTSEELLDHIKKDYPDMQKK